MLNRLDDYPVHQTPEPLAHAASSDRNVYDRYFFNGYDRDGSVFFAFAMGLYPNRRVLDASFSVVRDGVQTSVHASRLAPLERTETRVGPLAVEVLEPMRALRLRVEDNPSGLRADLEFRARTAAVEEPRTTARQLGRATLDSTRFTQWGAYEGTLEHPGGTISPGRTPWLGCRDRSWGVRPVGEREAGAPGGSPQFFWLWAPLHFDDVCAHFDATEDGEGRVRSARGSVVQLLGPGAEPTDPEERGLERMARVGHRISWQPGTRRARAAELVLEPHRGEPHVIRLEPLLTFQMLGIGYFHPEWGHGLWKGEQAVGAETWKLADLDPLDLRHLHVQQLCRARLGAREGVGVLEQLVIGPHAPSGFRELLDGAPGSRP